MEASQCSQCCQSHLDLQRSSALQHEPSDLLQQVKGAGAALDLQSWNHITTLLFSITQTVAMVTRAEDALPRLVDSILDAVLTVSPNRQ